MMRLWLLKLIPDYGYDVNDGFVIRAASEKDARDIAASKAHDEGKDVWLDAELSNCIELLSDGEPGLILQDFHAG